MLSNSKKINPSIKSKITMSKPATNIKKLKANMTGLGRWTRMSCPPSPKMPENLTPESFSRISTQQKNLIRRKRGLTLF